MRFRRLSILLVLVIGLAAAFAPPAAAGTVHVLRVGTYRGIPGQFNTIQDAVNSAKPGDWILVAPGTYHEHASPEEGVRITTPGIHLRGMDRKAVIVDGTSALAPTACSSSPAYQVPGRNGIVVHKASGVYVENLTVCNFLTGLDGEGGNEVWWNGGD